MGALAETIRKSRTWDPKKHPRDANGRFAELLSSLPSGTSVIVSGGSAEDVTVRHYNGSYRVVDPNRPGYSNKVRDLKSAAGAAKRALEFVDRADAPDRAGQLDRELKPLYEVADRIAELDKAIAEQAEQFREEHRSGAGREVALRLPKSWGGVSASRSTLQVANLQHLRSERYRAYLEWQREARKSYFATRLAERARLAGARPSPPSSPS